MRFVARIACFPHELLNAISNEERLVFSILSLGGANQRSALAIRPDLLAFAPQIVRHDSARRLQNYLSRAVVLLKPDDLGVWKILLKFENVANISSAPGIDALVFVSDSAYVLVLARH